MINTKTLICALTAATSVCLAADSALACEPYDPCLGATTFPADGASGVARNVHLTVAYDQVGKLSPQAPVLPQASDVALRAVGGELVACDIAPIDMDPARDEVAFELVPRAELLPNTAYELVHRFRAPEAAEGAGPAAPCLAPADDLTVVATFLTGEHSDTRAPSITGQPTVHVSARITEPSPSACGPYEGCLWSVEVQGIDDDSETVWLTVDGAWPRVARTKLVAWDGTAGAPAVGTVGESETPATSGLELPAGEHTLVAVDGSGNRSAAVAFTVPACAAQAYPPELEEDGFPVDDGVRGKSSSGCSVQQSQPVTSAALSLLTAVSLFFARHRNRQAAH